MGNENDKKINSIPLRKADTKEEQMLMGAIQQEAERIGFGVIVIECVIKNGKVGFLKTKEVSRTFNLDRGN